jgi:ATP-dependent helicase HepA
VSALKRHHLVRWPEADGSPYGVIIGVEGTRVEVRFDDGQTLTFAADGEALERVALEKGTPVTMPATGKTGTVADVLESKGLRFYELTTTAGTPQHVPESGLRPLVLSDPVERLRAGQLDAARSVNARLSAMRLRYAFEQDELASLHASRVEIKPHQVGVVHRVTGAYPHRFILADEVGLGKTIEAGLIIRELKARDIARRVLILAPSGLVSQWQSELKHKFNQVFADYRGPLVRALQAQDPQENVWTLSDNVVTSNSFAAYDDDRAREIAGAGWDLVVVDEAHHARRTQRGDRRETTRLYRLLERLVDPEHGRASSALFLTATPMQLDPFELYSLIELLDPTLFASSDDFERNREQLRGLNAAVEALENWPALDDDERRDTASAVSRLLDKNDEQVYALLFDSDRRTTVADDLSSRHRLSQVMIRNRKKNVGGFMPRVAAIWEIRLTPDERAAYDALTRYAREGFARSQAERRMALGFVMVMFQKLATSSSRALRRALLRRIEKLEATIPEPGGPTLDLDSVDADGPDEPFDDAVEEQGEDQIAVLDADADGDAIWQEVQDLERIVGLLDSIEIDTKTRVLIERLEEIRHEEPDARVLIFTQFRGTQDELLKRIPKPWTVHLFHGSLDSREKDAAVARCRDEPGPQILVSTEAGGEGRNLQFCHILVNYDLPWNPMKVEQRIGRVDRIGQRHAVVVASFSTLETVEERVVEVLSRRLGIFEETVGGLDPILGTVESDLRRLFLYAEHEAERARQRLEATLEQRVRLAREAEVKLRDLIMDERSLLRDEVDRLLARTRTTTADDLRRFCLQALDELGGSAQPHPGVPGTFDVELRGRCQEQFPQLYRENSRRHVTFDRAVAQDRDEVEFLAFGHELVDGLVNRVCSEDYPGRSSARIVQSDELAPTTGWLFVYAIELDGVVRRRELFPVFVHLDGEEDDDEAAHTLLKLASEMRREEQFGDSPPLALPSDRTAIDAAATAARSAALARMVDLEDELEPANTARLKDEQAKLQRFLEYKQDAADKKLDATQRVFDRVSVSEDPEVLRIAPVWLGNLERARRDRQTLDADGQRRLQALEDRATVGTHTKLLTASYVEVGPDPRPLLARLRASLPEALGRELLKYRGRPTAADVTAVRVQVSDRRSKLEALAADQRLDRERALRVGRTLEELLNDAGERPQPERTIVYAAARYYLDIGDYVHDLRSPNGFEDDEAVVAAVCAALDGKTDDQADETWSAQ